MTACTLLIISRVQYARNGGMGKEHRARANFVVAMDAQFK